MNTIMWIALAWAALACVFICGFAAYAFIVGWSPPRLDTITPRPPVRWPKVSVLIAARNEADTIESALTTLLAEDYPNLELVVVDDRSTDDTGRIIDRLAERDPRVRPLHLETLPPGWLGKVHALARGVERASGEWFLFTDADVHFSHGALRTAVAHALERDQDFVAVLPTVEPHGLCQAGALNAFGLGFTMMTRADRLETDPEVFVGIGAFNLLSREIYEKSEGLEWLKMEVADDVGLGLVARRAGAKQTLLVGGEMLRIDWYPTLRAMIRGLEKNAFAAGARFSFARLVAAVLLMLTSALAPFALLFASGWFPLLGMAALLASAAVHHRSAHLAGLPPRAAWFTTAGILIIVYTLIRSAAICYKNGGIRWRDTYYPLEALRAGQRVQL